MSVLIIAIILLLPAIAIMELFNFKIEHSLFITICSIIVILIAAGLLGFLSAGTYIIYALSALSLCYLGVVVVINRKRLKEFNISRYLTPGIVIFLLTTAIYAFIMRGKMLWKTDTAVHWGYATRMMFYTGTLYKGIQTLSVPIFNYFIVKTIGYQESYLYVGRWIIIWAPLILATSYIKWDKWYKAAIYAIGAYMLCGVIESTPALLMDLPLGIFAGGLCAMLAIENDDIRTYITASFGIFILTNIKNAFGLVMSIIVMGFALLVCIVKEKDTKFSFKKQGYGLILMLISILASYIVNKMTIQPLITDTSATNQSFDYTQIISNLKSIKFIGLLAITLIVVIVSVIFYIKWRKQNASKKLPRRIIILSALSAVALLAVLYKTYSLAFSGLSHSDQVIFADFWDLFFTKGYWGKQIRVLLTLLIGFTVIVGFVFVKREYRTKIIAQSLYMVLSILGYALLLVVAYIAVFSQQEAAGYAAHHRYLGSVMAFAMAWLLGLIFMKNGIWQEGRHYQLICCTALIILVSRDAPALGTAYHFGIRGEAGTHINAAADAKMICSDSSEDSKVYFIAQNDDDLYLSYWSTNVWLRYEIAPRYLNWDKYSLGHNYDDSSQDYSLWNTTPEIWSQLLVNNYDYVYIYIADDGFWEEYGYLFDPSQPYQNNALYKVNPEGDYLLEFIEAS